MTLTRRIPHIEPQKGTKVTKRKTILHSNRLKPTNGLFVRQKNGKELKGRMIEATDTTLTIDRDGKPFIIARGDVRQVYVVHGKAQKVSGP